MESWLPDPEGDLARMTDDVNAKLDALHAEIRALRQEQATTRRVINAATMRHSWAKHLGAMSAAMAAFGDKPPPEIPLQADHDG